MLRIKKAEIGRLSRTNVFIPALARYPAVVKPLCPPPMMMASYCFVISISFFSVMMGSQTEMLCWMVTVSALHPVGW